MLITSGYLQMDYVIILKKYESLKMRFSWTVGKSEPISKGTVLTNYDVGIKA